MEIDALKTKFLNANIPFQELDQEMIELIAILNFDLGLKTEFCCYGHSSEEETYVVFNKIVSDEQILSLAQHLSESKRVTFAKGIHLINNFGEFNKWIRNDPDDGLTINWTYSFPKVFGDRDIYEGIKEAHMKRLIEDLKEYKPKML